MHDSHWSEEEEGKEEGKEEEKELSKLNYRK